MKNIFQNFLNIFDNINKDKSTIIAKDREHLVKLINKEINKYGKQCSLNHIDVTNITDMSSLFSKSQLPNVTGCNSEFNGDISKWNTSNVINMSNMFACSVFNNDISNWNVSKVKKMTGMFANSSFNNDISNWNTSNVEDMQSMFSYGVFNGNISNWNVSKVYNMCFMFSKSLFYKDISNWRPYELFSATYMLDENSPNLPYWINYGGRIERNEAIDFYHLQKRINNDFQELNTELNVQVNNKPKRIKL